MKYDNLCTTETRREYGVTAELDRANGIMRLTNRKNYVCVMPIPMDGLRWSERQIDNEMHNWSVQAWNDNDGQIVRKSFNGSVKEGTIEYSTRREHYVRWSGGNASGILRREDQGTWYDII